MCEELGVQTRIVTDASVPHALHALARDEAASMIVVGSTARGHAGRVIPGSTAERMLHRSPCAVALTPRGYVRAPVETVAVGFLDSPEGHAALAVAHMLAGRTDAKLRVVVALHASSALDALPAGVEVESEIHVDDPADVLLRVSAHAGLLVCGSRGYGPLRSVLLGGVSRRLVDAAQCPVLVLPREAGRPLQDLFSQAPDAAGIAV